MLQIRPAILPQDAPAILAMDIGLSTDSIFRVLGVGDGFRLAEVPVEPSVRKTFPVDDLGAANRPWDQAWVAEADGSVCGFAASGWQGWNRRTVLWHFYVDAPMRGQGIGRSLLQPVLGQAMAQGARHLWLETSNYNPPGVAAYRALGFAISGFDLTLYDGTPSEGEFALFLSRPVA
jgi:ribosomal protein S18 acetylase RimI-like enzyme